MDARRDDQVADVNGAVDFYKRAQVSVNGRHQVGGQRFHFQLLHAAHQHTRQRDHRRRGADQADGDAHLDPAAHIHHVQVGVQKIAADRVALQVVHQHLVHLPVQVEVDQLGAVHPAEHFACLAAV